MEYFTNRILARFIRFLYPQKIDIHTQYFKSEPRTWVMLLAILVGDVLQLRQK